MWCCVCAAIKKDDRFCIHHFRRSSSGLLSVFDDDASHELQLVILMRYQAGYQAGLKCGITVEVLRTFSTAD